MASKLTLEEQFEANLRVMEDAAYEEMEGLNEEGLRQFDFSTSRRRST